MARPGLRPHRAPGGGGGGSTGDTGRPRRRLRRRLRGERSPAYRGAGEREPVALPGGRPAPGCTALAAQPRAAAPSSLPWRPERPWLPNLTRWLPGSPGRPRCALCTSLAAPAFPHETLEATRALALRCLPT